jgi:hypothetical protein
MTREALLWKQDYELLSIQRGSMSRPIKQQISLITFFLMLLAGLNSGCGYEDCKTDKQYVDKPGICGKIYRTEQSKKVLNEKLVPKIYWILGIMFSPIIFLVMFRIVRAVFQAIADLISRLIRCF